MGGRRRKRSRTSMSYLLDISRQETVARLAYLEVEQGITGTTTELAEEEVERNHEDDAHDNASR